MRHGVRQRNRQRNRARVLARRSRGAGLFEYILLVGLVALAALGAWRAFGATVREKASRQADCVASLDPGGCRGEAEGTSSSALDRAGNPKLKNLAAAEGATYEPAKGTPGIEGTGDGRDFHPSDISQGQLGDCYFMSSLAAIAHTHPDVLAKNIKKNDDGTYTVTFFDRGLFGTSKVEVKVTADFPKKDGRWVFAQPGDKKGDQLELWPMLYEKAYAQWKGGGSYKKIEGGVAADAMSEITGESGDWTRTKGVVWDMSFDTVADYADKGYPLVASSLSDSDGKKKQLYKDGTLVTGHAYWIEKVDRDAKTVTVRNPWGWNEKPITLPWDQFKAAFWRVHYNTKTR